MGERICVRKEPRMREKRKKVADGGELRSWIVDNSYQIIYFM